MTSTTHPNFGATTEASEVAASFPTAIKGRTILITGINKLGIGYATAEALASHSPHHLILAGRSPAKVQDCIDSLQRQYPDIDYRVLNLDLSSQKSVRGAATKVLDWTDIPAIDLVINNAAVMNIPTRTLSEDGIELHLATNHVGHFLFTTLIMPKILAAAESSGTPGSTRIVNVSSLATAVSPLRTTDINWTKPTSQLPEQEKPNFMIMKAASLDVDEEMVYIPMAAYGHSKTANILFSVGLNERLFAKHGVLSVALHPGEIQTELTRTTDPVWHEKTLAFRKKLGIDYKTLQAGASTTVVAALDPKLSESEGQTAFLSDCQIGKVPPYAVDRAAAESLWGITEGLVGEKLSW